MSHIEHSSITSDEEEYEDDKVVETDPNGRYVRFEHKLGSGAFKTVYRALDTERGIEVAWNQVMIDRFQLDKDKVLREIDFFKKIRHKHVIDFYHFWTDERKNQVVFITELMPSGTLTDYIEKSPEIKLKIIKSWCKQILLGLNYLHTQEPPIIHRDIKCANIFINGTTEGEVKIGDLGLATFCQKKDALSVIGTPEFMAPEYYNEVYTTTVDIWAFGMAMIEMVTKQCPYAECDNVGQIFKKVSGGVRPQQLDLILDTEVRDFINLCLADEDNRPTAAQLLEHNFFVSDGKNDSNPVRVVAKGEAQEKLLSNRIPPSVLNRMDTPDHLPAVGTGINAVQNQRSTSPLRRTYEEPEPQNSSESSVNRFDMHVVSREGDILNIVAEMGIENDNTKESSKIEFNYNLATDDASTTAAEMVRSLELSLSSHKLICDAFEDLEQRYFHISLKTKNDRTQTITELSELIVEDVDSQKDNLRSSGDSIRSEPIPEQLGTPSKFQAKLTEQNPLSDSETPNGSFQEPYDVSNLNSLVENHLTVPTVQTQNNTDLEDLLDEDDKLELLSDSEDVQSVGSTPDKKPFPDDDDIEDSSSEGSKGHDDDAEISALKAKHQKDMQDLIQSQKNELRKAAEEIKRKKREKQQQETSDKTTIALKGFYDQQQKKGNSEFRQIAASPSPLCI